MDSVGVVVAELIESAGRGTRSRLATALGVDKGTVSRWADGRTPDRRYWAGIESFFGLDPGHLGAEGQNVSRRLAQLEAQLVELQALAADVPRLQAELAKVLALAERLGFVAPDGQGGQS